MTAQAGWKYARVTCQCAAVSVKPSEYANSSAISCVQSLGGMGKIRKQMAEGAGNNAADFSALLGLVHGNGECRTGNAIHHDLLLLAR